MKNSNKKIGHIFNGYKKSKPFSIEIELTITGKVNIVKFTYHKTEGLMAENYQCFEVEYDRKNIEDQIKKQLNTKLIKLSKNKSAVEVGGGAYISFPNIFSSKV
jgi:hypothetical protein